MSADRVSGASSRAAQALFEAARSDAPGAAARAKVWSGVSAAAAITVGGGAAGVAAVGAGAGAAGIGASGAGLGTAKMIVAGTLFGGAVTVGLAAMLLYLGPSRGRMPPAAAPAVVVASAPTTAPADSAIDPSFGGAGRGGPGAGAAATLAWVPGAPLDTSTVNPAPGAPSSSRPAPATHGPVKALHGARAGGARPVAAQHPLPAPPSPGAADDDALTHEASLVAAARSALAGGNAREALRLVRSARSMPAPQLVPEELTVEAQALRALGNADEARGVDSALHSQYPDSALAR